MIQLVAAAPNWTRALARAGVARQRPYDPFCQERALREGPGELLGEVLMNMLEDEEPAMSNRASVDFWARVTEHRRELMRYIVEKRTGGELLLWAKDDAPLSDDPIVGAMNAALWANSKVDPQSLPIWVSVWWQD